MQLRDSSAPLFAHKSGGTHIHKRGGTQTRWNPNNEVEPTNEPRLRLVAAQPTIHCHPLPLWILVTGQRARASAWLQPCVRRRLWAVVTLLGLIHSILLGQIYEYYFDRQGALYQEISALSHRLPRRSVCTRPALGSVSSVAVSASTRFTLQVRPDRRQAGRPSCDPPRGVALADLREALVQCKVIFCNIHTSWLQGLVSVARGPAALGWPQAACLAERRS